MRFSFLLLVLLYLWEEGGGRFDEWYKRRIKRIYPSLLAVALIGLFVFNREDSFADVILAKQYWFIQCIFILYPLLYLAKEYIHNHFVLLLVLTGVVMAVFPFVQKVDGFFWGGGYYRWAVYLLFLLLGAIMGKERESIKQINGLVALAAALGCAMIWYGLAYILKTSVFLFVSIMPMMGAAIFTYLIGKSKTIDKLLHSKYMGTIIVSIGALCLESYLIQKMIITSAFNNLFPWNIPLIMLVVILASLVAKILANLIGQIFDSQPLNWRNVIKFY